MIKIKEFRVKKPPVNRGITVSIPAILTRDWDIKKNDILTFHRDEEDRLIIVPKKKGA